MADAPEVFVPSEKEVAPNPLRDSYGPEVDGQGLEAVQQTSDPPTFWSMHRLKILITLAIVVVGAVVGGAVGGTVGKDDGNEESAQSPDGTSTTSRSPTATATSGPYPEAMFGTATPQVRGFPSAVPGAFFGALDIIVYLTGSDGALYQTTYLNGIWDDSIYPVGLAAGEIAPLRERPGQQLVRSGPEHRIVPLIADFSTSNPNVSFQVPTDYPEAFAASGIEMVDDNHAPVLAFMIGLDGILYHSIWESDSSSSGTLADGWSDWLWFGTDDSSITDWYNYTPTAIASGQRRDDGQFERLFDVIAVRRSDNSLWRRTSTDGRQWSSEYVNMGGFCTSRAVGINLAPYDDATYSLLTVRGGDGRLWYSFWNGTATSREWSPFRPVAGSPIIVGEPFLLRTSLAVSVFVIDENRNIWHAEYSPRSDGRNEWTEQPTLNGTFESLPKAVSTISVRLDLFMLGQQGQLLWQRFNESVLQWFEDWVTLVTPP